MFKIQIAPTQRLIEASLGGFLTVAEVRAYAAHMEAAHYRYFRSGRSYRLVLDASAAKIQAQDVLAAFATHVAGYPPAERIGVVCGASLNRFQILRTLDRPYLKLCDNLAEAREWALGDAHLQETELRLVATSSETLQAPEAA
jgi:hypothetical protein